MMIHTKSIAFDAVFTMSIFYFTLNDMNVLVTGGAGFIGSHIVDHCVRRGDSVVCVDDMSFGKKENLNSEAPHYEVDIFKREAFDKVIKEFKPEIIFHLAALARIQSSFDDPERYVQVNTIGTFNVLSLARKYGARRVIYSASSSAYGDQPLPVHEDLKLTAQAFNPYASTKRMAEMLMRDMGRITGGPETVCLRYFNVYGPRQHTSADGPYPTVVSAFLDLFKAGKPLTIVPDGNQRRDFTWVEDVVAANLKASSASALGSGEIVNIGSGKNYSIWDVARLMLGVDANTAPEELITSNRCVFLPPRKGEIRESLADITRARKLLEWEPKVFLEDGIEKLKQQAGIA